MASLRTSLRAAAPLRNAARPAAAPRQAFRPVRFYSEAKGPAPGSVSPHIYGSFSAVGCSSFDGSPRCIRRCVRLL